MNLSKKTEFEVETIGYWYRTEKISSYEEVH